MFSKNAHSKDYYNARCKECMALKQREWYANNKDYCKDKRYERYKKNAKADRQRVREFHKKNPNKTKEYNLRSKFGIEIEQFNTMLNNQHGKCQLCNLDITGKGLAVVDHDHVTGKIRDLLCSSCNTALGHFKENSVTMRNAADYVEHHRKVQ